MTITPEERARELVDDIGCGLGQDHVCSEKGASCPCFKRAFDHIAFAIREAELDAMRAIRDSFDAAAVTPNSEADRQMVVDAITAMILLNQAER